MMTDDQNQSCADTCHNLQEKLQTTETLNSLWDFFSFLTFKLVLKRGRFDDIIIIEEQLQVLLAEFMRQVSANAFNNNETIGATTLSYIGSTSKGRA
jgi:hypothetical protein